MSRPLAPLAALLLLLIIAAGSVSATAAAAPRTPFVGPNGDGGSTAHPRLDGGEGAWAAVADTKIEIVVGDLRRQVNLRAIVDADSLERPRLPLRVSEASLRSALGEDFLAAVTREKRDARVVVDADDRRGAVGVIGEQVGQQIDMAMAVLVAEARLNALVAGRTSNRLLHLPLLRDRQLVDGERLVALLPKMRVLGAHQIRFTPSVSNGYGANLLTPGRIFAGQLILPGETFDFWKRLGPVTRAAGFRNGGAFINGRVDPTGSFAGGICATATALYVAAFEAGLPIVARTPHYSYLPVYPLGMDATVWTDATATVTMSFRNDTGHPLVIVVRQSPRMIRYELLGIDDGRKVTISTGRFYGVRRGPGGRAGGYVTVTRTIRGADGELLHRDWVFSRYFPS